MYKMKINLDTGNDALKLVYQATQIPDEEIYISDTTGHLRVRARSIMGALYSMEFKDLWLETEKDHYHLFKDFAAE